MTTITKRQIANRVLKSSGFDTITNSSSSREFNDLLELMEDTMLALGGNQGVKVGYIKSTNPDYIEPDEPSGIADRLVLYVKDIMIYKFLNEYNEVTTPKQDEAYRLAMTYILPELMPAQKRVAPIPLGQGNRTRQSDLIYKPKPVDDIEIEKATDLQFYD